MYVYEEVLDGRKLTEIINTEHENTKYLPGIKLPENIVAVPDVAEAAGDADLLIFVVPHGFVPGICKQLEGKMKPNAFGISLIKGFGEKNGKFVLMSQVIEDLLKIPCSVLMGANLANEVAKGDFCESTIGCKDSRQGEVLKRLFHTPNFMITVVNDVATVEICGALKNIVACAAGFSEGLGMGDNTKAAVIRLGMKEMIRFCKTFYANGFNSATFFESCGVADLVTTCYGGRNRKVSLEFAKHNGEKTLDQLEKEMLNGQKLQGPQTAKEVYDFLKEEKQLENFPLFVAVHLIAQGKIPVKELISRLRAQPQDSRL
jgi:glycerol-3-phosphate dehydrogenase (NAD+)